MSLYENINRRKKLGKSRPKSKSTIDDDTWSKMEKKKGGFSEKKMIYAPKNKK